MDHQRRSSPRIPRAKGALLLLLLWFHVLFSQAGSRKTESRRTGRGHQLLSMSPNSGSPMGGTQVTVTLSEEVDIGGLEPYVVRCQFGDKVVPAQSIFAAPESQGTMPELRVLCLAPAGAAKSSVQVRVTLDGHTFLNGPNFAYRAEHQTALS
eukprot:jgi/Tetstr1/420358/TSEL_011478.t1